MRLGLVGYGAGGRLFHAPYIDAADGVDLVGVVTRSPERRAQLAADRPDVPIYDSLADLLAAGVDAVTITTPPQTRHDLVLEALAGGAHVVADKPFAPSAAAARELADAAKAAGLLLAVFHNRRWDTDVRTVRALIDSGRLGDLWRVESRFELDEPSTLDAGPTGGLLRDLGTHLVDQMMWLLGPVRSVYAELDEVDLPEGRTDAGFAISLVHASGVRSRVAAGKLNRHVEKSWRVYGSGGSYVSFGSDTQTQALLSGRRPADEGERWGYEAESRWGLLSTADGVERVPSERGAYQDYYSQFAAAVAGTATLPVTADEGAALLDVLDAARRSAAEGVVVPL
ncbi:Gfo/Idh/MocA family oxidoreductase [Actinotalea sp. M2MS4P-6]|uniref:Gfo/Idh/MocA family oxidoreductase n=1 Tax=Actinotalea sp. M2MS4P-6 TaxID=2983762 RepID=UPI0021E4613C|nr:Gfo/Idh/MocA family oxidoreductase [Actinotalea sp. M2MS4P-6]MCV2396050.1 Gfo/Idh/MocA family oxidoreductase [Actinotalea sp. M2MS4P-6]